MSAIANIAISDGMPTPVVHTFTPMSTNPAVYRNGASESSSLGIAYDETISINVRPVPDGISKVDLQLQSPHDTSTTVNDGSRVFDFFSGSFKFPPTSTPQQRKNMRLLAANLLLNSQAVDAIDNLAGPY